MVGVAREELVGALAGEHDLDGARGRGGQQVVGHRAAHEGRLVRLDAAHHLGQHRDHLVGVVDPLVVLQSQLLGDPPGGDEVGAPRRARGERVNRAEGCVGVLGHDRGDEARVEPTGEEDPDGHVGHHPAAHGGLDGLADAAQHVVAVGELDAVDVQLTEALQAARRRPAEPWRKLLHRTAVLGRERTDLGGEHRGIADPRPVERLDADRVARDDEAAVGVGHREGEHAAQGGQVVERGGVGAGRCGQGRLGVGVGAVVARRDGPQLGVVVDLAVDHGPVAVLGAQRLVTAVEVDDREACVPEPGLAHSAGATTVGATVGEAVEHRLAERDIRAGRGMDRDDAAHDDQASGRVRPSRRRPPARRDVR